MRCCAEFFHAQLTIFGSLDSNVLLRQQRHSNLSVERIVLSQQHPQSVLRLRCVRLLSFGLLLLRTLHIEQHRELRAHVRLALDADFAAHSIDDILRNRHAQAAALRLLHAQAILTREGFKNMAHILVRHADAVILHDKGQMHIA